jgi:hypothetical protein
MIGSFLPIVVVAIASVLALGLLIGFSMVIFRASQRQGLPGARQARSCGCGDGTCSNNSSGGSMVMMGAALGASGSHHAHPAAQQHDTAPAHTSGHSHSFADSPHSAGMGDFGGGADTSGTGDFGGGDCGGGGGGGDGGGGGGGGGGD